MYQIVCRLRLCPRFHFGSLQRSPEPLAVFRGATSKGRGEEEKGREGERGDEGGSSSFALGRKKKVCAYVLYCLNLAGRCLMCNCRISCTSTKFPLYCNSIQSTVTLIAINNQQYSVLKHAAVFKVSTVFFLIMVL